MLTVVCLFVKGEYPYTPEYVHALYYGVRRHLARPFTFVCLTDQPWLFRPPIETRVVRAIEGVRHTFWTKLRFFDPALGLQGRVLSLDLDTLIVGDLSPIVDYPAAFACAGDLLAPSLEGPPARGVKDGRLWIPRVQGSCWVWDAGVTSDLWTDWHPSLASKYYTDQDWVSDRRPDVPVMPVSWFPRLNFTTTRLGVVHGPPWPDDARVLLVKKEKNHRLAARLPWFAALWRALD